MVFDIAAPNGDINSLDIYELSSYQSSNYDTFAEPIYGVSGTIYLALGSTNTQLQIYGALDGNTDITKLTFQIYEYTDPEGDGTYAYNDFYTINADKSSGNLGLHSSYEAIDGDKFLSYISGNSSFATLNSAYASLAQTSFASGLEHAIEGLALLQVTSAANTNRADHIVDNLNTAFRKSGNTYTDIEIDAETFSSGAHSALTGPSTVDPGFLGGAWTSQTLDLSGVFKTSLRTLYTDSNGDVIPASDSDLDLDDLFNGSVQDADNLFGVTPSSIGGNSIEDIYGEFLTSADNWLLTAGHSEDLETSNDTTNDTSNDTSTDTSNDTSDTTPTASASGKTQLGGSATYSGTFAYVESENSTGTFTDRFTLSAHNTAEKVTLQDS